MRHEPKGRRTDGPIKPPIENDFDHISTVVRSAEIKSDQQVAERTAADDSNSQESRIHVTQISGRVTLRKVSNNNDEAKLKSAIVS